MGRMNILTFDARDGHIQAIVAACRKHGLNEQGTPVRIAQVTLSDAKILPEQFVALAPEQDKALAIAQMLTKRQPQACTLILSATPVDELIAPNTLFVGMRDWTEQEYNALRQNSSRYYSMHHLARDDLHDIADAIMEQALSFPALHVFVDLSILDPLFFPESVEQVPAGMSARELLYFLQRLSLLRNFRSASFTGWKPPLCENSVKTLAKLVVELERRVKASEQYE